MRNSVSHKIVFIRVSSILIVFVILLISLALLFSERSFFVNYPVSDSSEVAELHNGESINFNLMLNDSADAFTSLSIRFDTHNRVSFGQIDIILFKNNEQINVWNVNASELLDDNYITLKLEDGLVTNQEDKVVLQITSHLEDDRSVGVYRDITIKRAEKSLVQREIISFVILFVGLMTVAIVNVGLLSAETTIDNPNHSTSLFNIAVLCLLFYAVFFEQLDGMMLTEWGSKLIDCIRSGDPAHYPDYLIGGYMDVSNYNIVLNILTAIMILPVYSVHHLFNIDLGDSYLSVYDLFRKVLLIVIILVTSILIRKIIAIIAPEKSAVANLIGLNYLVSPIVLCVVSMGQVDVIAIFIIVLSIYYHMKDKPYITFLLMGFSVLIKPFSLFIFVIPLMCLYINMRKYKELIKGIGIMFFPLLISYILSDYVFGNYGKLQSISMTVSGHVQLFFSNVIGGYSLFILGCIIIYGYLLFRESKEIDPVFELLKSSLFVNVIFFSFANQYPQWFSYSLVVMLLLLAFVDDVSKYIICITGFGLGSMTYSYTLFRDNLDLKMISNSWVGSHFKFPIYRSYMDYIDILLPRISPYINLIGKTLVLGMTILFVYLFCTTKAKRSIVNKDKKALLYSFSALTIVNLLFGLFSLLAYFDLILI